MSRMIAIGDIHGCGRSLNSLLQDIGIQADDTVVSLGDYVDRGPDSRGVIDQLISLKAQCKFIPLLGNHEILFRESCTNTMMRETWLMCGGRMTIDSYGSEFSGIPDSHHDFLDSCQRYYESDSIIFAHANYEPHLTMDQQEDYVLFWTHLSHFFAPSRHFSGKTVIVGHTPQRNGQILDLGHLIGIDTNCFGGGWLTALDVTTWMYWQAREDGATRRGKLARATS